MKNFLIMIVGGLFIMFLTALIITPEKDSNGNYTNIVDYWTK